MTQAAPAGTLDTMGLAEAMLLLPADERAILLRARDSGWSVERIARHFDVPPDVVKRRLHDALRRLLADVDTPAPGEP
jgi:DNA-directed RNA polymerase specialized sigma24 family protein